MSARPYSEYTDSGATGLGSVPSHWTVTRLGRLTASKCDGPFGTGLKSDHYTDSGVRVVRLQNIRACAFNGEDAAFIDESYAVQELQRHAVMAGDLLIAGLGDERNTVGRACVAPQGIEPAIVKADCFRFRLRTSEAMPSFLAYQLCATSHVDAGFFSSGSTRSRIPLSDMASRIVAIPSIDEQRAITVFLDRETDKIDGLVAEQERLMTLLREKRQAVISHAVTKGINTDAPLKCSGVFWLGDIPAHWDLVPLKRPLRSIEQGWSPQCEAYPAETDDEWGVLKVGAVNGGTFNPRENKLLPSDLVPEPSLALRTGDLLVSRANTRELVGSAAVVRSDFPRLLLCDKLYRLRFDPAAVDPEFVSSFLGSSNVRGQIELVASGASASMVNIAQSAILELRLPVPPTDEQVSILDFIRRESDKLHALSVEAEQATTLLLERRRALIIAAVTGQIDVRHLAPADAA